MFWDAKHLFLSYENTATEVQNFVNEYSFPSLLTLYSVVVLRTLLITVSCSIAFANLLFSLANSAYRAAHVCVTGGSDPGPEHAS